MTEAGQPTPLAGFLSALQRSGREFEAVVHGRSMQGCFDDGDRILVRPATAGSPPRLGDIVVHLGVDGRLVVHRVVATGRNWRRVPFVITKGDNQVLCDMPVDAADVQGTVTAVCRDDRRDPPPPRPAGAGWRRLVSSAVLSGTTVWAWMSGPGQRRRVAAALLGRRRPG